MSESKYTQNDIHNIVENQRLFFRTNQTLDIDFRIDQLYKLKQAIIDNEKNIKDALKKDLNRSETEAFILDIGTIYYEIDETIEGLRKWSKPEIHYSGLLCFPSLITKVYKMPYGVTLIISPFNFPFLLSLGVLIPAIAAGNTACIKLSSKSFESTSVICDIINNTFEHNYIYAIDGGHDVADFCLNERFDKIFYTGSPNVGKHVMEMASKNLTPVALELGGETGNWCIIRKDANLKDAARKIAFFKICNAGQICININQIAVAKDVAQEFISYLIDEIKKQIGEDQIHNDEYCRLITASAYDNCLKQIDNYKDKVVYGGNGNKDTLQIETTILYPIDINDDIVQKELFNPILPIVEFDDDKADELVDIINSREHGLALYIFTKNIKWANMVMSTSQFGGGCINEVTLHMMVKGVPFNGTGHSGMGAYHGEWGFREFSHPTTVLRGHSHFNLSLRQHPYNDNSWKEKIFGILSGRNKKDSFLKDIIETIIAVILICFILVKFVMIPCQVEGKSMIPTLAEGDHCYSFIITRNIGIHRFDICVVNVDDEDKLLVKRIIGLPNETIEFYDNKLYVNGEYVSENFLHDTNTKDFEITLGDDEYFCMGDNRDISKDSRFYGPFKESDIVSTNIFVLYPFDRFGVKK